MGASPCEGEEGTLPLQHHLRLLLQPLCEEERGHLLQHHPLLLLRLLFQQPSKEERGGRFLQHHPLLILIQQPSDEEPSSCEETRGGNILLQYPLLLQVIETRIELISSVLQCSLKSNEQSRTFHPH